MAVSTGIWKEVVVQSKETKTLSYSVISFSLICCELKSSQR